MHDFIIGEWNNKAANDVSSFASGEEFAQTLVRRGLMVDEWCEAHSPLAIPPASDFHASRLGSGQS